MSRPRAAALTVLAALTPLGLVPSAPATAAEREPFHCFDDCTFHDASKDAAAKADILHGRINTTSKAFKISFKVRDLQKTGKFVVGAGLSGWGDNFTVTKHAKGYTVTHQTISETRAYKPNACKAARLSWSAAKNTVAVTLPFSCTGSTPGGGTVVNGIDFRADKATDHVGRVFYKP